MVDVQGTRFVPPILQLDLASEQTWMSRAAKMTLAVSAVACVGTIWVVHYMQRREREVRLFFCFFLKLTV